MLYLFWKFVLNKNILLKRIGILQTYILKDKMKVVGEDAPSIKIKIRRGRVVEVSSENF